METGHGMLLPGRRADSFAVFVVIVAGVAHKIDEDLNSL